MIKGAKLVPDIGNNGNDLCSDGIAAVCYLLTGLLWLTFIMFGTYIVMGLLVTWARKKRMRP